MQFWLPFRDALRHDLSGAMETVNTTNRSFAQRLEGMDKRQITTFARNLGPARYLSIREGIVANIIECPKTIDRAELTPWQLKLGNFATHYLTLARNALIDRVELATEHFALINQSFGHLLRATPLGTLIASESAFAASNVLMLQVSMAMEVMLDRVLNGAGDDELQVCLMSHAASDLQPRNTLGAWV